MFAKLVIWFLKHRNLSKEDRMLFTGYLVAKLGGLPIHGILTIDGEGKLLVRGAQLAPEQLMSLRESADALLNNQAWKLIHEQVLYQAVSTGTFEGQNLEQVLFSRAGVWFGQEERKWFEMLAGTATDA